MRVSSWLLFQGVPATCGTAEIEAERYTRGMSLMLKRTALALVLALASLPADAVTQAARKQAPAAAQAAEVFLTPTCGCCSKWTDHLEAAGFKVTRVIRADIDAVPARQRVPASLRSCHTAVIGKYLVEGHVPADVIQKMLKERPAIAGIAVPGMPMGSPGMEGPNPQRYTIVAFQADGTTSEYARR